MAPSPLPEWKDDGSLPLDGEGQLPFFLVDAHEESARPGDVFLFGKVQAIQRYLCEANILTLLAPTLGATHQRTCRSRPPPAVAAELPDGGSASTVSH